jgi:hypothetical protein
MLFGVVWVYLTWPCLALFPKAWTVLSALTFVTSVISYITYISPDAVTTGYVVFVGPLTILWIMEMTKPIVFEPREDNGASDPVVVKPWVTKE